MLFGIESRHHVRFAVSLDVQSNRGLLLALCRKQDTASCGRAHARSCLTFYDVTCPAHAPVRCLNELNYFITSLTIIVFVK
jgi:hypothetical protein